MPDAQWPKMAESEFDAEGVGILGTSPTSIVNVGMWGANNQPSASIQSAGCAYCDRWAIDFYIGYRETVDGVPLFNTIHRRMETTLIYFCDRHSNAAANEILETHGGCSNSLNVFDLAHEVERQRRNSL